MIDLSRIPYQPAFPKDYHPGIGIIGCGNIMRMAHLPAYQKHNLRLIGVYDVDPAATVGLQERYNIRYVYPGLEDLLADPEIEVVDIATSPEQRVPIILEAIEAGKHVLSQKPLAPSVAQAKEIVEKAEQHGVQIAVNQNGRWSPPWRIATLLIQNDVIGEVISIMHYFDVHLGWVTGTHFDAIPQWILYDYSIHWFDITQCWLGDKTIQSVRARSYRTPDQPPGSIASWGMWSEVSCRDGTNALLRSAGSSRSKDQGHYFWVHGTKGTITGSVLPDRFVELDQAGFQTRFRFEGQWYPDGFAGTMGELLSSIAENREPFNSARNNTRTLALTLAACASAERDGEPVDPKGIK